MSEDWSETKSILQEVEQLFNRDDDIRDIVDIKKMANEIQLNQTSNIHDAKELIKQLTNEVTRKEMDIIAPPNDIHAANMDKVISDREKFIEQVEQLHHLLDKKLDSITKIANNTRELREKCAEYTINSQTTDARTAYAMSLYTKITNITWDYKVPQHMLAGHVGIDSKSELHRFDIDTNSESSFDISNKLWAIIGSE